MKIKVAVLDNDRLYLNRLNTAFSNKYYDKVEMYSFTNMEAALSTIEVERVDVFVANVAFDVDTNMLPKRCSFAYLTETTGVEKVKNQRTVCKYQKLDLIYKEILVIFSEGMSDSTSINIDNDAQSVIFNFTSPAGGVGNSTVAIAFAKRLAKKGNKVLYLNLENFGTTNLLLNGEGTYNFSDVIYALKSKKSNIALRLESFVKTDNSGVCFYDVVKNPLDIFELNEEDISVLIKTLKIIGNYKYIIIDKNLAFDKISMNIYKESYKIVFVSDGSSVANEKLNMAYKTMDTIEKTKDIMLTKKSVVIYNKFRQRTGKILDENLIQNIGGFPYFENAENNQVVDELLKDEKFDNLLK